MLARLGVVAFAGGGVEAFEGGFADVLAFGFGCRPDRRGLALPMRRVANSQSATANECAARQPPALSWRYRLPPAGAGPVGDVVPAVEFGVLPGIGMFRCWPARCP